MSMKPQRPPNSGAHYRRCIVLRGTPDHTAEQAMEDEDVLHESAGTNKIWQGVYEYGEVNKAFDEAATVVKIDRMHFHRFASTPVENNAVVAEWLPHGDLDFFCNNSSIKSEINFPDFTKVIVFLK